jgi:glyoxylase-like metal-dependent hydrolase (beta-lactamase superfamily II)
MILANSAEWAAKIVVTRQDKQMTDVARVFRQLIDARSSTYSYLLADAVTGDAVLIDPVFEQFARDAALVRELGLTLRHTLETHVHADHVTAAWLFRERLGSSIVVPADAGAEGALAWCARATSWRSAARRCRCWRRPGTRPAA